MNTKNIPELVEQLRSSYSSGLTRPVEYRIGQLKALYRMLEVEENAICEAIYKDLRKSKQETITTELLVVRAGIVHMLNHIYEFMEHKTIHEKPIFFLGETVEIRRVPHGVVLVLII